MGDALWRSRTQAGSETLCKHLLKVRATPSSSAQTQKWGGRRNLRPKAWPAPSRGRLFPGDFDLAPFHRFPSFQMKKHNVCVQVHKSADPAAWPLLPLVARSWPSPSAGLPHAPARATASPAPPQSSLDIPHPASPQTEPRGPRKALSMVRRPRHLESDRPEGLPQPTSQV